MTAKILDGKAIARQIQGEVAERLAEFMRRGGKTPCLAAVLVGDDPASDVYVRNKQRACARVGIDSRLHRLPASTSETALLELVAKLNESHDVHGVLVQLPLPAHIPEEHVLDAVHPLKDVDCFHPENVGRLVQGRPRFSPCTPHGVQQILYRAGIEVNGRLVTIVGRSEIVGKPLAVMLAQRDSSLGPNFANGTVTVCHSRTFDLADTTRRADILVTAIGQPELIKAGMIKPGAAVIDVGVNRTEKGLVGDVDFAAVREVAGAITPVPGGVGPLTIAMLLHNTLVAAEYQAPPSLRKKNV